VCLSQEADQALELVLAHPSDQFLHDLDVTTELFAVAEMGLTEATGFARALSAAATRTPGTAFVVSTSDRVASLSYLAKQLKPRNETRVVCHSPLRCIRRGDKRRSGPDDST
jgi:hypothetical protein